MSKVVMSKRWKAVAWLAVATGLTVCSALAPEPWFQVSAYAAVMALLTAVLLLLSARSGPAARAPAHVRTREVPALEQLARAREGEAHQAAAVLRIEIAVDAAAQGPTGDFSSRLRNLRASAADAAPELTEEVVAAAFSAESTPDCPRDEEWVREVGDSILGLPRPMHTGMVALRQQREGAVESGGNAPAQHPRNYAGGVNLNETGP